MDDFLGFIADSNGALKLSKDLVSLLSLGGFKLTKFVSNVPNLENALTLKKYTQTTRQSTY